jgi:hypothetical protein
MDGEPQQDQLTSKIQYKDFEPGEFTGRQERSYEQTITLIERFPWETEKDHLVITLTNPSVTIEGPEGDFLKLALYYNGKFVLHYLTRNHKHLYTKSLFQYKEAYPIIQSFFTAAANTPFDPQDLKQEMNLLETRLPHFKDGDFHYHATLPGFLRYVYPFLLFFPLSLVLGAAVLVPRDFPHRLPMIILCILFMIFGLAFEWVLLNHWRYCRNLVLVMTKGNDTFYFGPAAQPEKFNKKEIIELTTYGRKRRGGTYTGTLTREEISLSDGRSINLSSLMLDHDKLVAKLPGVLLTEEKTTLPFIPPSASIPS